MRRIASVTVLSFLCFLLLNSLAFAAEQAENKLGSFFALSGPIKYDKGGSAGYVDLAREDAMKLALGEGDRIFTSEDTTGELVLNYGARVSLEKDTEMELRYYNIRINRGGTWINFKPAKDSDGGNKFKVDTPVGTIGIKGTTFGVFVDPDARETFVQVREGTVSFENEKKEKVDIKAGGALSRAFEKAAKSFTPKPGEDIVAAKTLEKEAARKKEDRGPKKEIKSPFKKFRGADPK